MPPDLPRENPLAKFPGAVKSGRTARNGVGGQYQYDGRRVYVVVTSGNDDGQPSTWLALAAGHWRLTVAKKQIGGDWEILPVVDRLPDTLANFIAEQLQ